MTETQAAPDISCTREGACGIITLDRPKALNAITLPMVRAMARALDAWEADAGIRCVLIRAAGDRAFCAGGDIRSLYELGKAGRHDEQMAFFAEEYRLNRHIKRYAKPYVALIDGIVMGGGVGVTVHGSHRLAGERFSFAMPEVGIGFFPDVGASHFLPRLPGRTGLYLALTGARADAGDAVALGIATAHVPAARFGALTDRLRAGDDVDAAVAAEAVAAPASPLAAARPLVDACFARPSLAAIDAALAAAARDGDAFAEKARVALRTKSPTALAVTLRQIRDGEGLSIEAALQMEYRIAAGIVRSPDYYEGVRTTIIDKGQKPAWRPETIEAVRDHDVAAYFVAAGKPELSFAPLEGRA